MRDYKVVVENPPSLTPQSNSERLLFSRQAVVSKRGEQGAMGPSQDILEYRCHPVLFVPQRDHYRMIYNTALSSALASPSFPFLPLSFATCYPHYLPYILFHSTLFPLYSFLRVRARLRLIGQPIERKFMFVNYYEYRQQRKRKKKKTKGNKNKKNKKHSKISSSKDKQSFYLISISSSQYRLWNLLYL